MSLYLSFFSYDQCCALAKVIRSITRKDTEAVLGKNRKQAQPIQRTAKAKAHKDLVNELVHVFVDDQNLFWGIVNTNYGPDFRMDFGSLLMLAARNSGGKARGVRTAYIAGVVPDDDSFWKTAKSQGFEVLRGFLGADRRSKQDDAYLISEMVATLYESEGPSTIVLVAGDADYGPALKKAVEKGWRVEVVAEATSTCVSSALEEWTHEFRTIKAVDFEKERDPEQHWRGPRKLD